jgi:hypothetical protein
MNFDMTRMKLARYRQCCNYSRVITIIDTRTICALVHDLYLSNAIITCSLNNMLVITPLEMKVKRQVDILDHLSKKIS